MIKSIAQLRYWQIAVLGLFSSVTAVLLVAFAARVVRVNWPEAHDGIQIAYLLISAATAWIVTGIFIEAAFFKHRRMLAQREADAALDRIMDVIAGHQALGVASPFYKDEEADRG